MRVILPIFTVFAAVLFSAGEAWGQEKDRYVNAANQLVELISAGDYAGIQSKFNSGISAALPLDKASAFFRGLKQQAGKIQKLGEPRPAGAAMIFPATFEKGAFDMQITLDGSGLIAGQFFKTSAAPKTEPEKQPAQLSPTDRYSKVAKQFVEFINAGEYASIQGKFNKETGVALPLDKASEFLKGLTPQMGKLQSLGKPQSVGEGMIFPAEFEKDTLDMQIALDSRGLIAALAFTPHVVR